ncbi:LysR substrate-binding domain-containing protein [Celeribacter sp.]|uniref:LysR substrate-binding domain-containing protein n=1 Tax=Celeribacter sp. TaxID=1890673 RepID=UPI003A8FD641
MNALTLKHLRYFAALARQRHFGRAADEVSISQPAMSVQIRELEALIGAPLVERGARQIRLTDLGARFAEAAEAILRDVDALGDMVRGAREGFAGPLRIGVIPTIAPYILPRLITDLAARYPDLDPRPRETVTQSLIAELVDGRLDCALMALPVSEPALHEVEIVEEEFVLVRHARDADRAVPNPETLRQMRLLLLEEGHCFRDQALSYCAKGGRGPRDMMEGSSLSTLVQMVGAGIGVTLVPQMAVATETRAAPVSVAHLSDPRPTRTIGMVWRKTNPLGARLAEIVPLVREATAAAIAAGEARMVET